jgi:hypothetical protein
MEKVNYGPVETADFFNLEMLRRHAKNYTRVAKAAGGGIPARSAAPDRNRRLSGRRFADSRTIQHLHAAERPHLQPDASHPP